MINQQVKANYETRLTEVIDEQGKTIVAENNSLILAIDENNFELAVIVKETGSLWLSNPYDKDYDQIATGISREQLGSQLSITYYNRQAQEQIMNSYTDSVALDQVTMEQIEDGVKVTYTLGEEVAGYLIPESISTERFFQFLDQMPADDRQLIEDIYREDEEAGTFNLRTSTAVFIQEDAEIIFNEAGYTIDDYISDNEENEIEGAGGAVFTIPVIYKIEGDNFIASIPVEEVINHDIYTLTQIRLLEYFGTASLADEGYLFVPDGSGALIDFNNGKTNVNRYLGDVYGSDETLTFDQVSNRDKELSVKLPIYGMKKNDQAFLAILEDGETYASIIGDISERADSFNKVFPQYSYLPTGRSSLDEYTGSGILQLYQEEPYQGNFQSRYIFLDGEDANYSGMAKHYQQYLIDAGELPEQKDRQELPFYLELIGGVNVAKSFLGIPFQGIEVLTTYQEANQIVEALSTDDVADIKLTYSGWFNNGYNHYAPYRVSTIHSLEKDLNLNDFSTKMQANDIPLYFDVDFGYIYDERFYDGFSTSNHATRYFDNTLATLTDQNLASGNIGRETQSNPSKYILNSSFLDRFVGHFLDQIDGKAINHLSLRTVTSSLSSDFSTNNFMDRQASMNYIVDALDRLKDDEMSLLASNSNAYAFKHVDHIVDAPMDSNRYLIFDESIPFYQMVLSGYIDYAGQPLNLTDDYQHELLKTIETNAGLSFKWIHAPDHLLKETAYQDYYSVQYQNGYDKAVDLYHQLNDQLSAIQGQKMIDHERIEEDVYRVGYENGVNVYVNYSNKTVQHNQLNIEANNFVVEE